MLATNQVDRMRSNFSYLNEAKRKENFSSHKKEAVFPCITVGYMIFGLERSMSVTAMVNLCRS
jgi:hypothetical protein